MSYKDNDVPEPPLKVQLYQGETKYGRKNR